MILTVSIAIGLVLGFLFFEWVGFLPGGLVVPGYIALYLDRPLMVASTVTVSLLSYGLIKCVSCLTILYSRRRFLLMVITGFALQWLFELVVRQTRWVSLEMDSIGYIIPGLIANEMDRQGVLPTLFTLIILSSMVRLILIILGYLRI
ncbi:MAG: poly-gamma-glutamate biosynthesis protein PgsC [Desulfobacterales bacterium]|nr:MAG: poly-gamma-glutamate biosynthesis protein PgsC [Desulfobacterales bacterium]